MQITMASFIGLILASGGFCTALVVVGVYVGNLSSKFVSQVDFKNYEEIILKELKDMNKNITDLRLEFVKIEAIENERRENGEG